MPSPIQSLASAAAMATDLRCCGSDLCGEDRTVDAVTARYCIGARCAAWRIWSGDKGYCGLAGPPNFQQG